MIDSWPKERFFLLKNYIRSISIIFGSIGYLSLVSVNQPVTTHD